MPQGRKGKKSSTKQAGRQVATFQIPRCLKPSSFQATISFTKIFRYQTTASLTSQVTSQNLAAILSLAVTSTTGFSLVGAVLLKKVEAWSPAEPGALISLEHTQETTTFIGSPSKIYSDTAVGSTYPAHVVLKPPKNSLSGFWISGNATSTGHVVDIIANTQLTVIDFTLEIVMLDQSTTGQATTGTGMTPGVVYLKTLCGGNLVPVSYPAY